MIPFSYYLGYIWNLPSHFLIGDNPSNYSTAPEAIGTAAYNQQLSTNVNLQNQFTAKAQMINAVVWGGLLLLLTSKGKK